MGSLETLAALLVVWARLLRLYRCFCADMSVKRSNETPETDRSFNTPASPLLVSAVTSPVLGPGKTIVEGPSGTVGDSPCCAGKFPEDWSALL